MKLGLGLSILLAFALPAHADTAAYTGLDLKAGSALKLFDPFDDHFTSLAAPTLGSDLPLVLPSTAGVSGASLVTDGAGHLSWSAPLTTKYKQPWAAADGTTLVVTHGLGTKDVAVTVYDADGATVLVDTVRTSASVVTLTAAEAPTGDGWRVLVESF